MTDVYIGAFVVVKGFPEVGVGQRWCNVCNEVPFGSFEFCPKCGNSVTYKEIFSILDFHSLLDFYDKNDWCDLLIDVSEYSDYEGDVLIDNFNIKTSVAFANQLQDLSVCDLTDIDPQASITSFEKKHKKVLSFLRKYCNYIQLKFGVVLY